MGDEKEGTIRRRKTGRESWDHAGAKWSVAITLHELGFKVFREPELQVKGRTVRPDLVAIKGHGAIIVEIGQLQPRPHGLKTYTRQFNRNIRNSRSDTSYSATL